MLYQLSYTPPDNGERAGRQVPPAGAHGSSPEPGRLSATPRPGKRSGSPQSLRRLALMQHPQDPRPDNREVEEEQHKARPSREGPPRPSTEPEGSKQSVKDAPTQTDPGTGEQ